MPPERDYVADRVARILRDETRLALLGDRPVVSCRSCGAEVATDDAFSGRDPETGQRVYFCPPCNLEDES